MATTVTENPLNDFNSFSYHHFLILVSSTDVANTLTDSETLFRFITGEENVQGAQVIVNPLVSNRYVIQEIEWSSMLAANYADFGSSVWAGGTMKIIEPRGMSFMNDLYDSVDALGTQIENCLWMIKTVFVGDTGVSEAQQYQYINYVQPVVVMMTDLELQFDEGGGQYNFTFGMADSGAGAYKNMDHAAFNTDTTVNLAGGDVTGAITVQAALTRLQQHVNATYDKNHNKTQATADLQPDVPAFEKMQYEIVIPPDSPLLKPEYIVTNSKGQGMSKDGSSASITVPVGTSVSDAIMEIIKCCPKAMTDFVKDGQKQTVHIMNSVRMNAPKTNPRKICTLTVIVREAPTIKTEEDQTSVHEKALAAGNYLEYDYMYTGKNIDVLDFEMKMNTGIAFFNTVLSRSTMKDDRSSAVSAEYVTSASSQSKFSADKTKVFYNGKLGDPADGDKDQPTSVNLFDQMMRQYTMMDNVLVNLRIRGNPRLLNGVTPTQAAILAGNATVAKSGGSSTSLMEKWATMPVYCKVNVRMPKNGDYDTIEKFWYDGLYRVMTVKNVFSAGEFTQELELITEMDGFFSQVPEKADSVNTTPPDFTISGETAEVEIRIRAFMQMIRFCEGTSSPKGYSTIFGGQQFSDYSDHPRIAIVTPKYNTTAAGAYQILAPTWDGLVRAHGDLTDFTPEKQDMACYYLLQQRKALPLIRKNDITGAIQACVNEWASLPGSKYGQPTKGLEQAIAAYNTYIEKELAKASTLEVDRGTLS